MKKQLIPKAQIGEKFKNPYIAKTDNTTVRVTPKLESIKNPKIEELRITDPEAYNLLMMKYTIESQPNSEIVHYYDAEGNFRSTAAVRGMSGTDPIGAFIVEGVATGPIGKLIGKGLKALRMSKGYTGVPHIKIKGSDKYMDEAFPDYNGTIWSTNNRDYAHSFAQGNGSHSGASQGQVYRVWGTSKKPLKIPQPIEDAHYHWQSIPVKPKNKTLIKRGDSQVVYPETQELQLTESGVYELKPSIDKSIKIDNGGPDLNSPKGCLQMIQYLLHQRMEKIMFIFLKQMMVMSHHIMIG